MCVHSGIWKKVHCQKCVFTQEYERKCTVRNVCSLMNMKESALLKMCVHSGIWKKVHCKKCVFTQEYERKCTVKKYKNSEQYISSISKCKAGCASLQLYEITNIEFKIENVNNNILFFFLIKLMFVYIFTYI